MISCYYNTGICIMKIKKNNNMRMSPHIVIFKLD